MSQIVLSILLYLTSSNITAGNHTNWYCDGPTPVDPSPHIDYSAQAVSTATTLSLDTAVGVCSAVSQSSARLVISAVSSGGAAATIEAPSDSLFTSTTPDGSELMPGALAPVIVLAPVATGNTTSVGASVHVHTGSSTGYFYIETKLKSGSTVLGTLDSATVTVL